MSGIENYILMYMSSQNELARFAQKNIDDIKTAMPLEKLAMLIMNDTITMPGPQFRTLMTHMAAEALAASDEDIVLPVDNKQIVDPNVFSWFLRKANSFPEAAESRQKVLVFWGHGRGMRFLHEQEHNDMPSKTANVSQFIERLAAREETMRFDVVAFDACYMCMIETLNDMAGISDYIVVSSAQVPDESFPYQAIINEWKASGALTAKETAQVIQRQYADAYHIDEEGNSKELFICDTARIGRTADALNTLGERLAALLGADLAADPFRKAFRDALFDADMERSYVSVLTFLDMLEMAPQQGTDAAWQGVLVAIAALRASVLDAFDGKLSIEPGQPNSPLIWVPDDIQTYIDDGALYNTLGSSRNGAGGWASFWRQFHQVDPAAPVRGLQDKQRSRFELAEPLAS